MRLRIRLTALLCAAALLAMAGVPALAEGLYFGSHPADDVYMTQTVAHTCTLIAATMMLRNYSCQRGSPYEQVTDTGVGRFAWGSVAALPGTVWFSKTPTAVLCLSFSIPSTGFSM